MTLLILVIALALIFFINGFHDAANSIATIVTTRVLTPFQAVLWAAAFNFILSLLPNTSLVNLVLSIRYQKNGLEGIHHFTHYSFGTAFAAISLELNDLVAGHTIIFIAHTHRGFAGAYQCSRFSIYSRGRNR